MSQTAKSNFCGLLFEEMFQQELVKIGENVAKDIMENHTVIAIDLGVIVHASCVAVTKNADSDYTCTPFKFSSEDFYTKSGVESFCQSWDDQSFQEDIIRLSECHGRTQDIDGFSSHREAFKECGDRLITRSFSTEALKNRSHFQNRKRSYWDCQVEMIKEFTRKSGKGENPPILVIGKPTFKSSIKGKKSSCPKKTIEFLRRFFVVVVIDEHNTSKLCPQCFEFLALKNGQKGTRIWECGSNKCIKDGKKFYVNKDVSAAVNMFSIFMSLMSTGKRPECFLKQDKNAALDTPPETG